MSRVLVVHDRGARIVAEALADLGSRAGHRVDVLDAALAGTLAPASCDGVVLGVCLAEEGGARRWIRANASAIARLPTAYFEVVPGDAPAHLWSTASGRAALRSARFPMTSSRQPVGAWDPRERDRLWRWGHTVFASISAHASAA